VFNIPFYELIWKVRPAIKVAMIQQLKEEQEAGQRVTTLWPSY
jgi:hypothetical protein